MTVGACSDARMTTQTKTTMTWSKPYPKQQRYKRPRKQLQKTTMPLQFLAAAKTTTVPVALVRHLGHAPTGKPGVRIGLVSDMPGTGIM